jgi:hypothetical protein
MPARKNKIRHDDETRAKIQAARLIGRLQDFALADLNTSAGLKKLLTREQVSSIKVLLDKVLPNLNNNDTKNTLELSDPLMALIKAIQARNKR